MTDRTKNCLSVFFFLSMLVLPPVALGIGWLGWSFKTGAIVALITFAVLFLLGGIFLATVKDPTWLTVGWPFVCGLIYLDNVMFREHAAVGGEICGSVFD